MKRYLLATMVIVLVGLGAIAVAMPRSENTYSVTVYFAKTIGLFTKSDVRVLGVNVGEVTDVQPVGDKVRVSMTIQRGQKIPRDATAIVVPISLISDRYIQLSPAYTSGPALRDGAVLDVDQTAIPAELDDLLISLKKFLDALEAGNDADPGALSAAVTNLAAALNGTGDDIDETLGSIGAVSKVVNARAAELDNAVVSLSGLVSSLAQKKDQIASLNSRLSIALGAIAEEQASLDGALTNISLLTEQLGSIVKTHRSTLEKDLATLSNTTQAVMRHQTSLIKANDWLHVLSDGGEASHNMGAVHRAGQSNNPGITHIDVRDAHYGVCPAPFIGCNLLPGGMVPAAESDPTTTSAPRADARDDTDQEPRELLPSLLPDPLLRLPKLTEVPDVGPVAAGPDAPFGLPEFREKKPDVGFFTRLGAWLDTIFGEDR